MHIKNHLVRPSVSVCPPIYVKPVYIYIKLFYRDYSNALIMLLELRLHGAPIEHCTHWLQVVIILPVGGFAIYYFSVVISRHAHERCVFRSFVHPVFIYDFFSVLDVMTGL